MSGGVALVFGTLFSGGDNSSERWLRRHAGNLPREQTINETKDRFICVDDDDGIVMFLQWSCKFRLTRLANGRLIKNKKRIIIIIIRRRLFSCYCHCNCNTHGHRVNPLARALYTIYILYIFFCHVHFTNNSRLYFRVCL